MCQLILFNKPYDVLSQFTDQSGRQTLANYIDVPDVYPAGRLDRDSEGLLLLTDSGQLQHQISDPRYKLMKTYWVQVEGIPDDNALQQLRNGVELKDGRTLPAQADYLSPPAVWTRVPPIRERQTIPTQWLSIQIHEGKNRQVRRMTAAVGHPTLRLIRYAIGEWTLDGIASGKWRSIDASSMIKSSHDLEAQNHRRRRYRTQSTLSDGRRAHRRQNDAQPARRSSRRRRKPD